MMTKEEYYAQIEEMYAQKYESKDKKIEAADRRFREYLMRRNDDDDETDWWYRSEKENPEDQVLNDEELVETEVETKASGIEDQAVENEANSKMISAIVKEESIPQFLMVTEADSTCVQHTNVILQQVSISPLEHSLNFCKANLDVMGNCQYAMGKTHQIWSDSNFGCVNDDACQVFDVIPMRTKVLPKEHKERFHKSWRFKFKHRVAPRDSKSVSDVPRTTLGPSSMLKMLLDAGGIVVTTDGNAILREIDVAHSAAKSMIELSRPQDERVGVGSTSVIVLASELSQIAMPTDVRDRATVLGLVKSCIGTTFIGKFGDLIADLAIDATATISVDLGQEQGRSTQVKLFKNWKFKYKQKHPLRILPCNAQHGFRGRKRSMCKLRPRQHFCVLEILERSMVPSLLSSVSVSRGMLLPNESDFIEWNEYGTVNSSSVWHRWRYKKSLVMRAQLLLLGDESFQIKHKWRFKLLPLILECELYSDRPVLVTNYAQQLDISRLMIPMSVGWFTNLRSQLLFIALKWSIP